MTPQRWYQHNVVQSLAVIGTPGSLIALGIAVGVPVGDDGNSDDEGRPTTSLEETETTVSTTTATSSISATPESEPAAPDTSADETSTTKSTVGSLCPRKQFDPDEPAGVRITYKEEDDCLYYTGDLVGLGERHDYEIVLGEQGRLSVDFVMQNGIFSNVCMKLIVTDPRGVQIHDERHCSDGSYGSLAESPPAGVYTVRVELDNDIAGGTTAGAYFLALFDVG